MPEWTGKTRGGLSGYRSFVFLLKYGGIFTAYFALRFVVLYFLLFAPKAVKSSYYFLNKRLGFSTFKSIRYISRTFYKLGQVLIDKVAFLSNLNVNYTFDFEGEEHLRDMVENTGGVIIGAHAGSWEIAGQLLKRLNKRINIVMFADEHEKVQNFLEDIYNEQNVNFIVIRQDNYSHLYEISEALKKKEMVAIHGDRFLPGNKVIVKEFLNKKAQFPVGPFLIPVKYNVPVCFVTAMKETSKHYHFYATAPQQFNKAKNITQRETFINQLLEGYICNLETILKKYPDQWFNFYDFWDLK